MILIDYIKMIMMIIVVKYMIFMFINIQGTYFRPVIVILFSDQTSLIFSEQTSLTPRPKYYIPPKKFMLKTKFLGTGITYCYSLEQSKFGKLCSNEYHLNFPAKIEKDP